MLDLLNRTREAFADVVRETPGIAIAAFGLGMSVTARMVRLQVSAQTFPSVTTMALNGIILSACLLALALAYRLWPGFRLSKHPVVALATAVASSAALVSISLLPADAGLPAAVASETVPLVCSDVVLLIWAETLRSYGPRRSAVVFALAGAVASLTTLCLGTVKSEFELGVVAMLPILAVGGLFLFVEYNTSRSGFASIRDASARAPLVSADMLAPVLACLFLVRFCLAYATVGWTGSSSAASVASQFASTAGMLASGAAALALGTAFSGMAAGAAYALVVSFSLLGALFMSGTGEPGLILASVSLINVVQVSLILTAFSLPALLGREDCGALAFLSCALGTTCAAGLMCVAPRHVFAAIVGIALAVMAVILLGLLSRSGLGKSLECTPEVPSDEGEAVLEKTVRLYSLTPRETDIFRLLAKRESAEEIAESLVVSVATVRTHIRNIYAKMDVHSAKEFHALVEEACTAGESETQQE